MQIDLKTIQIEPKRKTFDNIVRRFGDKPASRYQEGSYDIQAKENLHYRPTWAPEQQLYDPGLSLVKMADWDAFKDPRQYFYSTYTLARARQQEAVEGAFTFVESRKLHLSVPADVLEQALAILIPLRHAAWASNQNNVLIAGYGYGTTFTQPCLYQGMDALAIAQYLSRAGLLFGGADALTVGRTAWLEADVWQPLRRLAEDTMIIRDPVELFVAQNFAIDGLLYPVIYDAAIDGVLSARGGSAISMVTQFQVEWYDEAAKWVDSVLKIAAGESAENTAVLAAWFDSWSARAASALLPVAELVLGDSADETIAQAQDALRKRAVKAGLSL
ncbi:phenol hydroxylase [Novosphingobium lubricantis]|uniref:phenol hydroxylase n=1 Tax=Novosphingobium sp. CCH12-A3 TaxID=1768752 RepID=UPI000780FD4E|nr:phenol hydroxylase [Novosphingobium sp. CCH12-A3]